jgi:hypothetical protein
MGIGVEELRLSSIRERPAAVPPGGPRTIFQRYSYGWLTLGLFAVSLAGHWLFGWFAYAGEQQALGQPPDAGGYTVEMLRDTFENWQSEFLQLLWQVGGLAYFLYLGSPQSKEGDERLEAKIDAILSRTDPAAAKLPIQPAGSEEPRRR